MTKDVVSHIVQQAIETLENNRECYIAQWIIQNPSAKISDYTMCHQNSWLDNVPQKFWMEKKSSEILAREDENTVVDYYKKTLDALEQRVAGLKAKIKEVEKL